MWEVAARCLDGWQPGRVVAIDAEMNSVAMRIAARSLFGLKLERDAAALAASFHAGAEYLDIHWPFNQFKIDLPFTPWGRFVRARRRLNAFVYRLIRDRQADPECEQRDDALAALLTARDDDGTGLTARQVRDQVLMLLGAGYDTTAMALTWTLYLLVQHPRVLEAVIEEQRTVLAGEVPDVDRLAGLTYLEAAIREALRIYPPGWSIPRVTACNVDFQGYRIPARTRVFLSPWLSHRVPEIFPAPDTFRPERFDPASAEQHPQFAFIPFGGGARLCIGQTLAIQEIKIVLSVLLTRWRLALLPGQHVQPRSTLTLSPSAPIRMRVAAAS
jgi:cytochrome P450